MPIKGFFGQYRFLSNFYPCPITYQGLDFYHTEGAFQAAKTIDPNIHPAYSKYIATLKDPRDAKKFGQTCPLRPDWEYVKFDIMYELLEQKFTKEPFKTLLLNTGNKYLEETNSWGDIIFGVCNGTGLNILGKLLMKLRQKIKTLQDLNK